MKITLKIFLLVVFVIGNLNAIEKYVVTELPQNANFVALNSAGQVVGSIGNILDKPKACIWDKNNGLKTLDNFQEVASHATDINEKGDITGFVWTSNGRSFPPKEGWSFRWKKEEDLTFSPSAGLALAINNVGDIIGRSPPFLWKNDETFNLIDHEAKDINDQGQVTHCNTDQILTTTGAINVSLTAINSRGNMTGQLQFKDRYQAIVIVKQRVLRLGPSNSGSYSYAAGLNDYDHIVGTIHYYKQGNSAIVWINGEGYDLNDWLLNISEKKIVMNAALSINNIGQILASGSINGKFCMFLLTPESQVNK